MKLVGPRHDMAGMWKVTFSFMCLAPCGIAAGAARLPLDPFLEQFCNKAVSGIVFCVPKFERVG